VCQHCAQASCHIIGCTGTTSLTALLSEPLRTALDISYGTLPVCHIFPISPVFIKQIMRPIGSTIFYTDIIKSFPSTRTSDTNRCGSSRIQVVSIHKPSQSWQQDIWRAVQPITMPTWRRHLGTPRIPSILTRRPPSSSRLGVLPNPDIHLNLPGQAQTERHWDSSLRSLIVECLNVASAAFEELPMTIIRQDDGKWQTRDRNCSFSDKSLRRS